MLLPELDCTVRLLGWATWQGILGFGYLIWRLGYSAWILELEYLDRLPVIEENNLILWAEPLVRGTRARVSINQITFFQKTSKKYLIGALKYIFFLINYTPFYNSL
jgi:hypothetical protein